MEDWLKMNENHEEKLQELEIQSALSWVNLQSRAKIQLQVKWVRKMEPHGHFGLNLLEDKEKE